MEMSEKILGSIKDTPKIINIKQTPPKIRKQSKQWSFDVEFKEANFLQEVFLELLLKVFARLNERDPENFSCGIVMILDKENIRLSRYNGPNHENKIAHYECHIHHATSESINRRDRSPEHENTQVTD